MSYRSLSSHCHKWVWFCVRPWKLSVFIMLVLMTGGLRRHFWRFIPTSRCHLYRVFKGWITEVLLLLALGWVATCPFSRGAVEIIPTSQHVCLLSSGVCMAWAHHSLADGNRQDILETLIAVSSGDSGGYYCSQFRRLLFIEVSSGASGGLLQSLQKEMAIRSSVLALRIPGMAEPGGLPSMGSCRVGHEWSDLAA